MDTQQTVHSKTQLKLEMTQFNPCGLLFWTQSNRTDHGSNPVVTRIDSFTVSQGFFFPRPSTSRGCFFVERDRISLSRRIVTGLLNGHGPGPRASPLRLRRPHWHAAAGLVFSSSLPRATARRDVTPHACAQWRRPSLWRTIPCIRKYLRVGRPVTVTVCRQTRTGAST